MRIARCFLVVTLLIVMPAKSFAHGGEWFTWATASTHTLYDFDNKKFVQSFGVNATLVLLNAGVEFKNINYVDSKRLSAYVGIGAGSFLQLQAGFSGDGFSMRARSDVILGMAFDKLAEKHPYWALTTLSFTAERYFSNPQMGWYVGIGVGFSINTSWGFKCFKRQ